VVIKSGVLDLTQMGVLDLTQMCALDLTKNDKNIIKKKKINSRTYLTKDWMNGKNEICSDGYRWL